MSDIIIETETETEEESISFEDLDCFWMENGLPVFMANREDICDVVESLGFSLYYLLTNNEKKTTGSTTNPQTKVTTQTIAISKGMQLFKVVNNFVGRTISLSNDPFDANFIKIEEEAIYNMPAIPHIIIDKLDQFFRLVDAQHGTESIVMLTYDLEKQGSEGWGVLVPDQSNTSVHCNYDPDSIATMKPDNVMIVGSVHSHPGMAAYASGTDHKDQADFDGIHITFGWQKSVNNGATQYHIEMQMAGKAYTLNPEDVFEDYTVEKDPDPEVVDWTSKVKKVLPPNSGGTHTGGQASYLPAQTSGTKVQSTTPGAYSTNTHYSPTKVDKLQGFEDVRKQFAGFTNYDLERNAIIVAEISTDISGASRAWCPSCATVLDEFNFFNGYCDFCYIPIAEKNSSIELIISRLNYYCADLFIDTDAPVYLWTINEDNTQSLMKIVNGFLSDEIKRQLEEDNLDHDYDSRSENYCCHNVVCQCEVTITYSDIREFDDLTRGIDFYSGMSSCSSCKNYYEIGCPRWLNIVKTWIDDKNVNLMNYKDSIDDVLCDDYNFYAANTYSLEDRD